MNKTKLGISVGLFGAMVYFGGLFGGYLLTVLLAGYVLWFEEDEWLKKSVIKAVTLMVCFSLLVTAINLIPNTISFINSFVLMFGGSFSITVVSQLSYVLINALDILEKVIFILLGLKALKQETLAISAVDKLIDKYMG